MKKHPFHLLFLGLVTLSIPSLITCSDPKINALEDERGIYSVYGALDLDQNPNYIRIKDLRTQLSADFSSLDATVQFENLETGNITVLRDTIVKFSDNYTHNFILNESLDPRKSYQLKVLRPDGNFVTSVATTPGITQHSIFPAEKVSCFSTLQITFQNVLPTEQIRLEVGFSYGGLHVNEITRYCEFERRGNQLTLNINTRQLLGIVLPAPGTNQITCRMTEPAIGCNELDSDIVQLRYLHLGPEWQRVFPFYPNDPEDIQDVENGLGFFGGYREDTLSYKIETSQFD